MEINEITKEMENLNAEIEEAKSDLASAKTKYDMAIERLQEEFEVKGLKEAKKLLNELTKEAEGLEKEIAKDFESLKNNYDWE